jgi:hypothetical protein
MHTLGSSIPLPQLGASLLARDELASTALGVADRRTGIISGASSSTRSAPLAMSVEGATSFDDGADHLREAVENCDVITTSGLDDSDLSAFVGSGGTPGRTTSPVGSYT